MKKFILGAMSTCALTAFAFGIGGTNAEAALPTQHSVELEPVVEVSEEPVVINALPTQH